MKGYEFLVLLLELPFAVYQSLVWSLNWYQEPRALRYLDHMHHIFDARLTHYQRSPWSENFKFADWRGIQFPDFSKILIRTEWKSRTGKLKFEATIYGNARLMEIYIAGCHFAKPNFDVMLSESSIESLRWHFFEPSPHIFQQSFIHRMQTLQSELFFTLLDKLNNT